MSRIDSHWPRATAPGLLLVLLSACNVDGTSALVDPGRSQVPSTSVASSAVSAGVCDYNIDEPSLTSAGWSKVFDDDFGADLSRWNVWTGGAFNNELQYYQPPNLSIDVNTGLLAVAARRENVTGATSPFDATPKSFAFTSGRIESRTSFSSSRTSPRVRMSARVKLPAGVGMWPAFWSYGDPWPTQGEIDVVEARGSEPYQYQTNYFFGRRAGVNLVQGAAGFVTSSTSLVDCFHVYEVIWEKGSLTFLLDNAVVDTKTGGYIPSMYGKKERVVVNLAVGGNFFGNLDPATIQPGTMTVDWVKVFTAR